MDVRCRNGLKFAGMLVLAAMLAAVLAVLVLPGNVYAEQEELPERIASIQEEQEEQGDQEDQEWGDPRKIGSYLDLFMFAQGINNGSIDLDQDVVLTKDIQIPAISANNWIPISKDQEHAYQGLFDGKGHSITGIKIDNSKKYPSRWSEGIKVDSYTAFLSFLGADGEVRNLHVEADIKDVNNVAGIVSQNEGIIWGCTFKGNLESNLYPNSGSTPSYCYPDGIFDDVSAESGCIAAVNMGVIANCRTLQGTTIYHGGVHCGGIVGSQIENGLIFDCKNNADVRLDETSYDVMGVFVGGAGGIAGSQGFSYLYGIEDQAESVLMTARDSDGIFLRELGANLRNNELPRRRLTASKSSAQSEGAKLSGDAAAAEGSDFAVGIDIREDSEEYLSRKDFVINMISQRQITPIVFAKPFDPREKPAIMESVNYGNVTCDSLIGGVCGESSSGDIINCENHGSVDGVTRMWGGGIAGYVGTDVRLTSDDKSRISGCTNYGDVNTSSYDPEAGLLGMYEGSYIGGIAGEVEDDYDDYGGHAFIDFYQNANKNSHVCGKFGVGGVIGYLVNGVDFPDPSDMSNKVCYAYELVNLGYVLGSDCVGGIVGACPGVVSDTVNYGMVVLEAADYEDYYTAGGLTGDMDATGACVSSYDAGGVRANLPMYDPNNPTWLIGGVTGSAAYDEQVAGTNFCYELSAGALSIVGSWFNEDNYGYTALSEMGGGAADVSMIALFDRSESFHKSTTWNLVDNVEQGGTTYYMTPQMDWCPLDFDYLNETKRVHAYPINIGTARVVIPDTVYNGQNQPPAYIKMLAGGVEIDPAKYEVLGWDRQFVDAGLYDFEISMKEDTNYTGRFMPMYTIAKADQTIKSVTPTTKTVKKGKTFQLKTKLSKGDGKVTYKKTSGNKNITVSTTGKVKTNKKLKKGSKYKIKVKVSVAATKNYNATSTTKTITVKVK